MSILFKLALVFALSTTKFLLAPALSLSMGLSFLQTWLSTTSGGIAGIFIFFFLSKILLRFYVKFLGKIVFNLKRSIYSFLNIDFPYQYGEKPPLRIFTRRSRNIVKYVRKYGLFGIAFLTPVVLSIPLGTFLVARYYSRNRYLVIYLCSSVLFWSLLMSSASFLFR